MERRTPRPPSSVNLNSAQETPPNSSPATGSGTLTLNADGTLSYNITYAGLTGDWTASHIHGPGAVGVPAGVIFPRNNIPTTTRSGTLSGVTPALNSTQLGYLQNQLLYVNIHSTVFGGGEIRGFLHLAVPEPATLSSCAMALAVLARRRRK